MGHTIPYWGRFLLFMELPRSFCPHLDDKWDQTCKIIKFTLKLARPYYTSPHFLHIKALLSNYIRFINTYIMSKLVFWRPNQFTYFQSHSSYEDIKLPWSLWYIHYRNHDLLCQNQTLFEDLWAWYVEYRYYISQQRIILVVMRGQRAPI